MVASLNPKQGIDDKPAATTAPVLHAKTDTSTTSKAHAAHGRHAAERLQTHSARFHAEGAWH